MLYVLCYGLNEMSGVKINGLYWLFKILHDVIFVFKENLLKHSIYQCIKHALSRPAIGCSNLSSLAI